ncbi:MAG TPA: hypothetical protein VF828_03650 [Patescibacteria group bacterium]
MFNKNLPLILALIVIAVSSLYLISQKPKNGASPFHLGPRINQPTPSPSVSITPSLSITPTPSKTSADLTSSQVYSADQLSLLKKLNAGMVSGLRFPALPKVSASDKRLPVYLVTCSPDEEKLQSQVVYIDRSSDTAQKTLALLTADKNSGFPTADEIRLRQNYANVHYTQSVSGVNAVRLNKNGVLDVNFYDSVAAYGGGSSRVNCIKLSTYATLFQFPAIKNVRMCINKLPDTAASCAADFQP